jgi:hypothetical protein
MNEMAIDESFKKMEEMNRIDANYRFTGRIGDGKPR